MSISRSAEHLVIAVSLGGGLGVDIERIADVEAGWDADLVLHPDEPDPGDPGGRAAMWCRKEAILKAKGLGLVLPMTRIRAADHDVRDLPAPAGFRIALARGDAEDSDAGPVPATPTALRGAAAAPGGRARRRRGRPGRS